MEYQDIKYLKENHPTIRLLNADNSPLIISFLHREFKKKNMFTISKDDLESNLSDYLYYLTDVNDNETYPKTASEYLEDWTNADYLRKYYPPGNDEPYFEPTHYTEKALEWIRDLIEKRQFIATESRLLKIISMLKEIAYEGMDDPTERLEELEKQKNEIENQIEKVKAGIIDRLSETQIKERYFEICDTIYKMLSDFKTIEYNFRQLDIDIREKQLKDDIKKDELLDDIFSTKDRLQDTDQGRSFKAFWELLLSQSQQDELEKLIEVALNLEEIKSIKSDDILEEMTTHLVDAGDRVNKTNHALAEQLRKFLDERIYLENKKIVEIIKGIKSTAVQLKDNPPEIEDFIIIEDKPRIEMIMERPFWKGFSNTKLRKLNMEYGSPDEVSTSVLYNQLNIDSEELRERIQEFLKSDSQVALKSVIGKYPVKKGLAEILTYIYIASKNERTVINEDVSETIVIWNAVTEKHFKIKIPQIIFCRSEA